MVQQGSFAAWLARQLALREWNQSEMARRTGVGTGTVSMWMQGKRNPKPRYCDLIADALMLPVDVVLEAAGHRPPSIDVLTDDEKELLVLYRSLPDLEQKSVMKWTRYQAGEASKPPPAAPEQSG